MLSKCQSNLARSQVLRVQMMVLFSSGDFVGAYNYGVQSMRACGVDYPTITVCGVGESCLVSVLMVGVFSPV